jgi:formyltetrahydrofolate synthetase
MNLDPRVMKDWQIAEAAEERMKPIGRLADEMGLRDDELIPYGNRLAKVDYQKVLSRLGDRPDRKSVV